MADRYKMKEETVEFIRQMLASELVSARDRMIDSIAHKFPSMPAAIERYQTLYEVEDDYLEWLIGQRD